MCDSTLGAALSECCKAAVVRTRVREIRAFWGPVVQPLPPWPPMRFLSQALQERNLRGTSIPPWRRVARRPQPHTPPSSSPAPGHCPPRRSDDSASSGWRCEGRGRDAGWGGVEGPEGTGSSKPQPRTPPPGGGGLPGPGKRVGEEPRAGVEAEMCYRFHPIHSHCPRPCTHVVPATPTVTPLPLSEGRGLRTRCTRPRGPGGLGGGEGWGRWGPQRAGGRRAGGGRESPRLRSEGRNLKEREKRACRMRVVDLHESR